MLKKSKKLLSLFLALTILFGNFGEIVKIYAQENSIGKESENTNNIAGEKKYSTALKLAKGEKTEHSGYDIINLYNEVIVSGNDTKLEEGSYTLTYIPKSLFYKPLEENIYKDFSTYKGLEITETETDYIVKTSFKALYGGYAASTPLRVQLLPKQIANASENIIKHEFHNVNAEKLVDNQLIIKGKARIESIGNQSYSTQNITDKVGEDNRIKDEMLVDFAPYSVYYNYENNNDPRDRRVYVTLPEGVMMPANLGWTKDADTDRYYKDLKRDEVSSSNVTATVNLQGIDMTEYNKSNKTKTITLSYSMCVIENGEIKNDLTPIQWSSTRTYYIDKNPEPEAEPKAYYNVSSSRGRKYINKKYEDIQDSTYNGTRYLYLPYHKERIDEYRIDVSYYPYTSVSVYNAKDEGAIDELIITKSNTEVPGYSYPSEIRLNLLDKALTESDKEKTTKALEGTKAYGVKYNGERVLLTENVPIVHNGEGEYFKFDGRDYKSIDFEYPNEGLKFVGREEILKFRSILVTNVIADVRPVAIDRLISMVEVGNVPEISYYNNAPGYSAYDDRSSTYGSFKVKEFQNDTELTKQDFSTSSDTDTNYRLQYDRIYNYSSVNTTNGDGFQVGEVIKTSLTYAHLRSGIKTVATNPDNLNIYYLVPDGIEPIEDTNVFNSIEVIRGYKEGYNLVVAKPKNINIPTSNDIENTAYNQYSLNFNVTNRVEIGKYNIYAAVSVDNNKVENINGRQYGILQTDTPSGVWNTINEDARNRPQTKNKFTNLSSKTFNVYPPLVLSAIKSVKLADEEDTKYASSLGRKAKIGDNIDYRWSLNNNSPSEIKDLTIIDILPYNGDKNIVDSNNQRGSKFKTPLKSVDGGDKFDIYYSTDAVKNTIEENKNANWVSSVEDMSKVTMIKAVLKPNQTLALEEKYQIVTHNYIENDASIDDQSNAYNSLAFSPNGGHLFIETLKTEVQVNYPKKDVELIKVDSKDENVKLEGVKFDLYSDKDVLLKENLTTNQHGTVIIPNLLIGKSYYLKEKETISGYKLNTEKIPFTVTEGEGNFKLVVKNHKQIPWTSMIAPKRTLSVNKKWLNPIGEIKESAVESIEVELYKNNVATGQKLVLNAENNWAGQFTNLEVAETLGSTQLYRYTVKEVGENSSAIKLSDTWYKVEYTGSMAEGFTITNKELKPWTEMIKPKRTVRVSKNWLNQNGEVMTSPVESIEVELYKNNVATGQKLVLNAENNWAGEFTNLEVSETLGSTHFYRYTVKEVGENSSSIKLSDKWFKVEYTGSMADGFVVTNKELKPWTPMKIPTRNISISKKWLDKDGEAITNPVEKIEVELYKDGETTGKKLELNAGNNWTAEFKNLKVSETYGSTNYHNYTIKEVGETESSIKLADKWYGVTYTGTMKDGFTITNKEKQRLTPLVPLTRDISVSKKWLNKDSETLTSPVASIEVELYKDGEATGKKLVLNAENNWTGKFGNLLIAETLGSTNHHNYTVKEVGENASSIKLSEKWYGVEYTGSMENGFVITNKEKQTMIPLVPLTRDISVSKKWLAQNGEALTAPVESIEVELYKDGVATGKKLELNASNNWTGKFGNLLIAKTLGSTNHHNYTVKEVGENASSIKLSEKWFKVEYTGSMQDGFVITNRELKPWTPMEAPTRTITVSKNWLNQNGEVKPSPVESIEVELYKDGVATGKKLELNVSNNWTGQFEKLEVAPSLGSTEYYQYTVKELGETATSIKLSDKWYSVLYTGNMKDGFVITNKELKPWTPMEAPTRTITVSKNWLDQKGEVMTAPVESIEVELYKDGKATGKKLELNAENNWTGQFEKLEVAPSLGSTEYYQYTVKEVGENASSIKLAEKWYKVEYTGSMKDGFIVTNKELMQWKPLIPAPIKKIKIIYDLNGGKWEDGTSENRILLLNKGEEISIAEAPNREGYKFLYWKGSKYNPGDKYTAIQDHTFVAQWEKIVKPEVLKKETPKLKDKKIVSKKKTKSNPRTGDAGIMMFASTILVSGAALYISKRNRKK